VKTLNVQEIAVIERAKAACHELVNLARPLGPLAGVKARGFVSSRAKWLLNEINKLELELAPANPALRPTPIEPEVTGETDQERKGIEERRKAVRAGRHR
jgi:hypothetical protein